MQKVFQKRRYQERAVENFRDWITNPEEPLATITIPTGTGKTATTGMCIETVPSDWKVLWTAHRKELISQAHEALTSIIPDRSISIERGKEKADPNSTIIVGSVQTLAKDREHLKDWEPQLVVFDEYHHYSEDNVQYEGLKKRFPKAKFVGLTATPYRFGGGDLPLGRNLINMDIGTAVERGYLVPPVPESLITNISLADVHLRAGDFNPTQLSKAVNVDSRNKLIADRIISLIRSGRQGICFAVDVAHSKALCELLRHEVRAAEVYGDTPEDERMVIMARMRAGEIDVLLNNLVATEGFDVPHLSFVAVARPTRSLGLFIQMIGRGLRTSPGKTDCIIVDASDKLKVRQSRITFSDMASHGDLYGDKKRASNVIKADLPIDPITSFLKHFPVFLNKTKDDRWRADEESFTISSWQLTDDQWVITWTAEKTEPKVVTRAVYQPWTNIDGRSQEGRPVKHAKFGEGHVKKIVSAENKKVLVEFGWGNEMMLIIDHLQIQTFVNEYSPTQMETKKVDKLFYICMPEAEPKGRVIQFTRNGNELVFVSDQRMERTLADSWLQTEAQKDGVLHLVRCGAKWKSAPATEKQKLFVEKMVEESRISFNIDTDNLTKGDASSVIEQTKWEGLIRKKFGSNYKDELLGYDNTIVDV